MDMGMIIFACLGIVCVGAIGLIVIRGQQKTIDTLTDKLMAKDYGEYKRNNHITITDEKPQRKPLSYYDDPSIEINQ